MTSITEDPRYAAAVAKLNELETRRNDLHPRIARALDNSVTGDGNPPLAAKLQQEREDLAPAVEAQRQALRQLHGLLSSEVCRARLPEYRGIVRRMVDAFAALAEASKAETAFRNSLHSAGYLQCLHVMALHDRIDPADASSLPARFVAEAKQFGFIA